MGEQSSDQNEEGGRSGLGRVGKPRRPESWGKVIGLLRVIEGWSGGGSRTMTRDVGEGTSALGIVGRPGL